MLLLQRLTAVSLFVTLVLPNVSGAEPADPTVPVGISEAEVNLSRALDEKTEMDFEKTPLEEVVDYLKELHKI
ncbi:MAG: hypothetical protein WBF93_13355 [Pirellulales bacterium]|nr:hypothetical protein [Pirellulales bacterium]